MRAFTASKWPFGIRRHFVLQSHRVALHVMLRGLLARKNRFHRPLQQIRRQRRLPLDRELFLGAKSAAARGQRDLHFVQRQIQNSGNLLLVVNRALALRMHLDAFALRQSQAGFRFEKCRLDRLRSEGRFDHVSGGGKRRLHVAARERCRVDQVPVRVHIPWRMHLRRARLERFKRIGQRPPELRNRPSPWSAAWRAWNCVSATTMARKSPTQQVVSPTATKIGRSG